MAISPQDTGQGIEAKVTQRIQPGLNIDRAIQQAEDNRQRAEENKKTKFKEKMRKTMKGAGYTPMMERPLSK